MQFGKVANHVDVVIDVAQLHGGFTVVPVPSVDVDDYSCWRDVFGHVLVKLVAVSGGVNLDLVGCPVGWLVVAVSVVVNLDVFPE